MKEEEAIMNNLTAWGRTANILCNSWQLNDFSSTIKCPSIRYKCEKWSIFFPKQIHLGACLFDLWIGKLPKLKNQRE